MRQRTAVSLSVATTLGLALSPDRAASQQASTRDQIVVAWTLVSLVSERDDGSKADLFGPSPKGIVIFTRGGHFSLIQSQAEVPGLAANDRARATPEEAMAVVRAAIAYRGTYTVDEADRTLSVRTEASTFANLAEGLSKSGP